MDVLFSPLRLDDFESMLAKTVRAALAEMPAATPTTKPEDELLDIEAAADFLGLAVQTVYNLVSADKLSSMKPGRKLYFSKADLINYIKSSRRCSATELAAKVEANLTGAGKSSMSGHSLHA